MALEEKNNNVTYLSIAGNGTIILRTNEQDPKAVKHVDEETNKVTYRREFKSISGFIKSLFLKENTFEGKTFRTWNVGIADGDEYYVLSFGESSNYAFTLLGAMFNVDLSLPVKIKPYAIQNGERKNLGCILYNILGNNEEKKIENFFFKSEKVGDKWVKKCFNNFPPIPDGADEDDYKIARAQQVKFLKQVCSVDLAGKIKEFVKSTSNGETKTWYPEDAGSVEVNAQDEPLADLPF